MVQPSLSLFGSTRGASGGLIGELFVYGPNRVAFESFVSVPQPSQHVLSSTSSISNVVHPISSTPNHATDRNHYGISPLDKSNKCILLGGLSDGFIPTPYTMSLSDMICYHHISPTSNSNDDQKQDDTTINTNNHIAQVWTLIQPILSSSYTGFGHGTLDRDVEEINELIQFLLSKHQVNNDSSETMVNDVDIRQQTHDQDLERIIQPKTSKMYPKILLIGHSTGCQQIVHYLKYGQHRHRITAAVLQAPVSDREAATVWNPSHSSTCKSEEEHLQQLHYNIDLAKTMKLNDQGDEMMPRKVFWAPITANRYYDLMVRYDGMDDYFSSDYTNAELCEKLSHISLLEKSLHQIIVAYSGSDEYVPKSVDTKHLTQRLCDAMNNLLISDMQKGINDTITASISSIKKTNIAQPFYIPNGNHNLSSSSGNDAQIFLQRIQDLLYELDAID